MSRVNTLLSNYTRHIQLKRQNKAASERVWFAVYPPDEERRVSNRLLDFEMATKEAGFDWLGIDLRNALAQWLDTVDPEERADWFSNPKDIELYARSEFKMRLAKKVKQVLASAGQPDKTIFALYGVMELFDYLHVADLLSEIENSFSGYLLVFFPGEREMNTYRFLCARDGWNYLATPILSERDPS